MNTNTYNILVTGACGVTSRSVVRALMRSVHFKDMCRFIGTDVCYNLYGAFEGLYEKVYRVPYSSDSGYRETMQRIIDENFIEYAIVIPEPEMLYWCEHPFNVKFHSIPPRFARKASDKLELYKLLEHTGLVPEFQKLDSDASPDSICLEYPMWMRNHTPGTTSGTGAFLAHDYTQLKSWQAIHNNSSDLMLSEYLSGRNLGCFLLYSNGELLRYGTLERCGYIMSKVAISGITGNTCKGRLINDIEPMLRAREAVGRVLAKTGEKMNGLVVVDMKENSEGTPFVTEINIRHVAMTEIMAMGGLNFAETQMLLLSGQSHLISKEKTVAFPHDNLFLRDVDGKPVWLRHFHDAALGEAFGADGEECR